MDLKTLLLNEKRMQNSFSVHTSDGVGAAEICALGGESVVVDRVFPYGDTNLRGIVRYVLAGPGYGERLVLVAACPDAGAVMEMEGCVPPPLMMVICRISCARSALLLLTDVMSLLPIVRMCAPLIHSAGAAL